MLAWLFAQGVKRWVYRLLKAVGLNPGQGISPAVEDVACGEQVLARLAHVGDAGGEGRLGVVHVHDALLSGLVDTKDGANADACWESGVCLFVLCVSYVLHVHISTPRRAYSHRR